MIYLDYAATTPMSEESLYMYNEVAKRYFGNTSSLHDIGGQAKQLLDTCRVEIAHTINGEDYGVYFTSGGSESNILAITSLLSAHRHKGKHLITTKTEHSSVRNLFTKLEEEGYCVTYLSVDKYGQIDLDELKEAITPETILASIQHANSEIGTIQPLEEIGAILKEKGVIFHSDCVQTYGKIPIDVKKAMVDSISISSHKIYGPKGVGAVYINPSTLWTMQIPNTTHEKGFRPGTVNVPGIAAFVTAAQNICHEMNHNMKKCEQLRQRFLTGLSTIDHDIQVEGHFKHQLPHIIGLSVHGAQGQYIMLEFNRHGIAISTGNACQVGNQEPNKTMLAIGKSHDDAKQFIRLSFGKDTTEAHIDEAIKTLAIITKDIQKANRAQISVKS